MKNKQVQPSWGRVFLVLALGMVLLALAHSLVVPTWTHMALQIGIMLLMYFLALLGYKPPETASLDDDKRDDADDEQPASIMTIDLARSPWNRKMTELSPKGKL
jgi:hypothetical protein